MESESTNPDAKPAARPMTTAPIKVEPHGAENPLKIALIVISIIIWALFIISIIGILYAVVLGVVFFIGHLSLIVHLRGSSVKLGPQQMPGLYKRVVTLSNRIGLKKVPDAYLVQSGGVLNAFATKFGSRNFIALYSDMVRSCGDNMDALDFIIGHELGHLHRGHLRWRPLKAPAMIIPFLGSAYYRSCEYTCDRYGKASCGDHSKCLDGLCLLASGARYAPSLNRRQFVCQTEDLNTVLMKFGSWFASHPPLAKRAAALEPDLAPKNQNETVATAGALLLVVLLILAPFGVMYGFASHIDTFFKGMMPHNNPALTARRPPLMLPPNQSGLNQPGFNQPGFNPNQLGFPPPPSH